jgi:hypothetical protein
LKYYLSYFPLTGLPTHPKRSSHSDYGNTDASISDVGNETSKDTESNNDAGPTKEKSNPKTPATSSKHAKSTKLLDLTQKVRFSYLSTLMSLSKFNHLCFLKLDGVIKQITCSAAQRSNFDQTAKELNVKVAPLIAGYGIQWNIRYQSYQKAINACKVIEKILKQDQEPNGAGRFADVLFSPRDCIKN